MKNCNSCGVEKPLPSFNKDKRLKSGYAGMCKDCYKAKYAEKYAGKYDYGDKYKKRNEYSSRKRYMSKYNKKRRASDPLFVIKSRYRSRLWAALNKKSNSSSSILGCDWDELLVHLLLTLDKSERILFIQKKEEYHIDHIIPISSAKNELDVEVLNHYTNLQLLTKKQNILKGSSV